MNAGFDIAKKDGFECMFFHDVDLVPENDKNIYECLDNPRHYSGYIDKWNYTIPFYYIYGGITAYSVEAFENINGFRYKNRYKHFLFYSVMNTGDGEGKMMTCSIEPRLRLAMNFFARLRNSPSTK